MEKWEKQQRTPVKNHQFWCQNDIIFPGNDAFADSEIFRTQHAVHLHYSRRYLHNVTSTFDRTHLYLAANMLTITRWPSFHSPEMSPATQRDSPARRCLHGDEDSGNVNSPRRRPDRSFHLRCSFAVVGPHSIIIMREVQLDRVYNGGFKCHSAGPDISLFDMESEWEAQASSRRELISTTEITNPTLSQSSEGRMPRPRHFHPTQPPFGAF